MVSKRLQNRVAESRMALPFVAVFAGLVWIAEGLVSGQQWIQFACFSATVYLMVELNNGNALIRIYSRMVSCTFLLLSSVTCFLYPSVSGAIAMLCIAAAYTALFHTYQTKSPGWAFYTFLAIGAGSMAKVHLLFFVPVIWLLMATCLRSLGWRSFFASLLGLLTPYWFYTAWLIYKNDYTPLFSHFEQLTVFVSPHISYSASLIPVFSYLFIFLLAATGTIHFLRTSYKDKIRTRMLYHCFVTLNLFAILFLLLQPQHDDLLMRIIIINTSALTGHFVALTHTRITNIVFIGSAATALLLIALSLWMH